MKRAVVSRRRVWIVAALVIVLIVAVTFYSVFMQKQSQLSNDPTDARIAELVGLLKHQSVANPPSMRLKEGLHPPTNKWFSGLAFSTNPVPVFPGPLSFKATRNGFEVGLPEITASKDTVFGPHAPAISVAVQTNEFQLEQYDDLSVDVAHLGAAGDTVLSTKVTEGSPLTFTRIAPGQQAILSGGIFERRTAGVDGEHILERGGQRFGVKIIGGTVETRADSLEIIAADDTLLSIFAVPDGASDELYFSAAGNPIQSTALNYDISGKDIITRLTYKTANSQETLFAALPHHAINTGQPISKSFNTLYGESPVYRGTQFESRRQLNTPPEKLKLDKISDQARQALMASLERDVRTLSLEKTDTYFGGKELYRAAQLLDIAAQIGAADQQAAIQQKLREALDVWLDPKSYETRSNRFFYYDDRLRGIVGSEPSFGSEDFNDHHFHYGYFIHAAAILARYDASFVNDHGVMIDALVNEIASVDNDGLAPRLRMFDGYRGHSWASGYADFGDGNNQESSSEAVNAWYATFLWSRATENKELEDLSLWLYSEESHAALTQWLSRKSIPDDAEYRHAISVINWGGKRDYANFFSPRAEANLGIQLIPMSPGHIYLQKAGASAIDAQLDAATKNNLGLSGQFGDYLLMYRALVDSEVAQRMEKDIVSSDIDDANSRTYLLAWLYAQSTD